MKCRKCKQEKPPDEFPPKKWTPKPGALDRIRQCTECKQAYDKAYRARNRPLRLEYQRAYYYDNIDTFKAYHQKHKEKNNKRARENAIRRKFGLTYVGRDAILKQQGDVCAICSSTDPGPKDWHIDHCHNTNRVRGILCHYCNVGLGHLKDSPRVLRAAIEYLEKNTVQITTTRHAPEVPKPFTWSYSKLKNFETCPSRYWHIDILKDVKEDENDQLIWGNLVHKALAERLSKGTSLPRGMDAYEVWCKKIEAGVTSNPGGNGKLLVELKFAITRDFGPTEYFARDVWYRGVADVLVLQPPVAMAVDWKTGKILEDAVQLALMACCVFAHHPEVQKIRTEYIWLKEDATSSASFSRNDMIEVWRGLWPRIEQLRIAHETTSYPPKPGGLCRRWCPVRKCPHYGEQA